MNTYVMRTLMKSEGQEAEELSLHKIETTSSSGKESKRSEPPAISGDTFALFRQRLLQLSYLNVSFSIPGEIKGDLFLSTSPLTTRTPQPLFFFNIFIF